MSNETVKHTLLEYAAICDKAANRSTPMFASSYRWLADVCRGSRTGAAVWKTVIKGIGRGARNEPSVFGFVRSAAQRIANGEDLTLV